MADASFDGDNLLITLASGDTELDVQVELYSAWKRWQLSEPQNRGYPPAFRTIGGDELTPGINAGAYYFIRNDLGWRIKPPEEDINVVVIGNLAPEQSGLDLVIPTVGPYTVLLQGLQPITQSVAQLLAFAQDAEYEGIVHVDTANGTSGLTDYPAGLETDPVDNLDDAITILNRINGKKISLAGALTLDRNMENFKFLGAINPELDMITLNGFSVNNTTIDDLTITGSGSGIVLGNRCRLDNMSGLGGRFLQCVFLNTVTLIDGAYTFFNCYSEVAGNSKPTLNGNNANVDMNIRDYVGGLLITNVTNTNSMLSIDMQGRLTLDSTITAGDIVVSGVMDFEDNSGGTAIVNKDGVIDGKDMKIIKQITAGNVTIAGDDLTFTVFDEDGTSTFMTFSVSADGRIRTRTS